MASQQHSRSGARGSQGGAASPWLTLTDLGRLYGISAMHCGRLLHDAGLRDNNGQPTAQAMRAGCASALQEGQRQGGQPFWHRQHCRQAFETAGLVTVRRTTLVQQWAALLSALTEGSPSISTSAAQMAEDLPRELVDPVNLELRQLGCSFQVQGAGVPLSPDAAATSGAGHDRKRAAGHRRGRAHAPGRNRDASASP